MKTASPELAAAIANGQQLQVADCYTFTQVTGTVLLTATSWGVPISYNGHVFRDDTLLLERSKTRVALGVEVDDMTLTLTPLPGALLSGLPWMAALVSGALDGARLRLDRVFLDESGAVLGGHVNFSGTVAGIECLRSVATVTVNSDLQLLNVQFPKHVYQTGCLNVLFDGRCAVNRAAFANTLTAAAGSTATTINASTGRAERWFDLGALRFVSGALAGTMRTIKTSSTGSLAILNPLPAAPAAGDQFIAWPGCDKVFAGDCKNKFANQANFRGFPFIPKPEVSL